LYRNTFTHNLTKLSEEFHELSLKQNCRRYRRQHKENMQLSVTFDRNLECLSVNFNFFERLLFLRATA